MPVIITIKPKTTCTKQITKSSKRGSMEWFIAATAQKIHHSNITAHAAFSFVQNGETIPIVLFVGR